MDFVPPSPPEGDGGGGGGGGGGGRDDVFCVCMRVDVGVTTMDAKVPQKYKRVCVFHYQTLDYCSSTQEQ